MPSTSKKQHNFMEAIAHSPQFAKKAGVPQSVGKDFAAADKGKSFFQGGSTMSKSSGLHNASYAAGGSVLPRSRDFKKEENTDFLKTKDRFTDRSADSRVSGAPGSQKTDDVYVKPAKCPPPSDKSEAPVRPRQ